MDISSPPQTTTTTTTGNISPTKDIHDLDPSPIHKHLSSPFTNGVLKRLKPRHHNFNNPPPVVVSYKECLKNHAASMGGHAVDGCGEFMPSPTSTPTDPTSLKCAACGCHRNFHRRDPDESSFPANPIQHVIEYQPHHRHHPPPPPPPPQPISVAGARTNSLSPADSPSPPPISSSYYPSAPHMLLALSTGLSAPPPESTPITPFSNPGVMGSNSSNGKKRFRTKFTQEQKDKMHELAEKVGWKMLKKDEDIIISFCNEIGVEKGVFKVWMHNNKMTLGKKEPNAAVTHHIDNNGSSGGGVTTAGIDFLTNINHRPNNHHQFQPPPQNNDSVGSGENVMGTNGGSSSSS